MLILLCKYYLIVCYSCFMCRKICIMNLEGSWYLFCRFGMYLERFLVFIFNFGIILFFNICFLLKIKFSSVW